MYIADDTVDSEFFLDLLNMVETDLLKGIPTPLSMEFSRQEYWSELSFPSPADLPDPGIKWVSCIAGRFFTL